MMISLLVFSLLAAEPAPSPRAAPAPLGVLAVGVTSPPELDKVASEVGRTLGLHLTAPTVEWTGYLKSRAEGCARELRCLLGAPGLQSATRLLHLRLRPLGGGRLAVDLRLVDVRSRKVLGRRAAVVETAELGAWSEAASTRLLTRADSNADKSLSSPFAIQPRAR